MPLSDFIAMPDGQPINETAGIADALQANAALGRERQMNPRGLKFGSPIRNFLGAIGDALLVANGQQPLYHQRLQEQRSSNALQSYLGNVDPELAGLIGGGLDAGTAVDLYKLTHPAAAQPTALQRNYEYLKGVDPKLASQYLRGEAEGSPLIANNGDGTFTIVPRGMVDQGAAQPQQSEVTATGPNGEKIRYNPDTHAWEPMGGQSATPTGNFPVSKVLDALTAQESHGDGTAVGPQTQYGRALGSTQLLPATAKEMAGKLGLAFVPGMLRSNDPKALQYQRALAEAYFREGLDRTGNLRDALRYYHGGPDRSIWGPKTNAYADAVLGRLGAM